MATYNGASYVEEQLASILAELGRTDEVVVVDDASTDDTVARILSFQDDRVRVFQLADNMGYVRAFEIAMARARNPYVFLSDQDDIWPAGRVKVMRRGLESANVVVGNIGTLGGPDFIRGPLGERKWRLKAGGEQHRMLVFARLALADMPYYGSAMAFRRSILDLAIPFPSSACEAHDWWIAILGWTTRSLVHVDATVVERRFHANNTIHGIRHSPKLVLNGRLYFIKMVWEARRRSARKRASSLALQERKCGTFGGRESA